MEKLIIANTGSGEKGKSTSIKEVFKLLESRYPKEVNIIHPASSGDVMATVKVHGILVGIESQGDPKSRIFSSLDYFHKVGCQIIVVACRLYGETTGAIDKMHNHGYQIIWTANDKNWDEDLIVSYLNARYSEHVVQLIEDRINGRF